MPRACPRTCRALAVLLAGLGLLASAGAAQATTVRYDADGTSTDGDWFLSNGATSVHATLAQPHDPPTVPLSTGPSIWAVDPAARHADTTLENEPLPSGQPVQGWGITAYVVPGSARDVTFALLGGSGRTTTIAGMTVPAGGAGGWYTVAVAGTLTQNDINGLKLRLDLAGSGTSTAAVVRTAFVWVQTDGPPPAPTITSATTSPGSTRAPALAFSREGSISAECRTTSGDAVVADWDACSSTATYDLGGRPDGAYDLAVRGVDFMGGRSAAATRAYVLDTTPPPVPSITAAPASPAQGTVPEWRFAIAADATAQCRLDRGETVISDWVACTSPRAYDLGGRDDGGYTFRVRAADAVGNTSADTSSPYVLDRTAPAAPSVTAGPAPSTADPAAQYAFSSEPGATTACRLERGVTVLADWAPCTSPHGVDLAAQPDGSYTFRVRATDAAGNTGADSARTHTLDRQAPAAPTISSGPAGATSAASPSFAFSGEAGTSLRCRLERGAAVVSDWSPCTSPRAYDLGAGPDGSHTFRVRAVDAAGNVGAVASRDFVLDRVAPPAPTITAAPAAASNDPTPTWAWTAETGAGAACRVEHDGAPLGDWAPCTSPLTADLSAQADGTTAFRVRVTDAAGNTSAETGATSVLDRVAPGAPTITEAPAAVMNDPTPAWSFTTAGDSTATCRLSRGGTVVADWAPCASPREHDLATAPDGLYTFAVRATDAAGNTGTPATSSSTLDRAAPDAPVFTAGPADPANDPSASWSFSAQDGALLACRLLREGVEIEPWGACSSPAGRDLSGFVDGRFRLEARATDVAGNTSPAAGRSFVLDRAAPDVPVVTAGPPSAAPDATPTFSFTGEAGATFACRLDPATTWAPCSSPVTFSLGDAEGPYTLGVRATDAAGNTSAEATRAYEFDMTAPLPPVLDSAPAAVTSDTTPTWAFSGTGTAFTCSLRRGADVIEHRAPCFTPATFSLAGEPDGAYTFAVAATDGAGNEGPATEHAFVLDTAAPAAPALGSSPAAQSADATPAWTWTAEAGSAAECRLLREDAEVDGWAPCATPSTADLRAREDGKWTLEVRVRDEADNVSEVLSASYVLDRAAPASPAISSGPADRSADDTPTWAYALPDATTARCRVERDGTDIETDASCTSPRTFDLRAAPDGTYSFHVTAVDAAGNASPEASEAFVLDRTAPAAPAVDGAQGDSSDAAPTWTFTAEPGAATSCRLERDGVEVEPWAACSSPASRTLDRDGTWTFAVRATDAAGNTGAAGRRVLRLDRAAPAAPVITSGPDRVTADDTPEWTFAAENGVVTECRLDDRAWTTCAGSAAYDLRSAPDGDVAFAVRAIDAAGNVGAAAAATITLDRTPPGVPAITAGPDGPTNGATPTWRFSAEDGVTTACRLEREGAVVADWAACVSPHTSDLSAAADGAWTFRVRAVDAAGSTGAAASRAFELDRSAPAAPVFTAAPAQRSADGTPTWSFTHESGATSTCRIDRGSTEVQGWAPCSSPHTADLGSGDDGTYAVAVRARDAAGNTGLSSTSSFTLDRTAPAPPVITTRPAAAGRDSQLAWTFTAEADTTTQCRLDRNGIEVSAWSACTSPVDHDLTEAPDGDYGFAVRATDDVGNAGQAALDRTVLDRAPPGAPTVTEGPSGATNDPAVEWSFALESGSHARCRVLQDAVELEPWGSCTSPYAIDLAEGPDGAHRFEVAAVDEAGNVGAATGRSIDLDRVPPSAPSITGGPDPVSTDTTPEWAIAVETGARAVCRLLRGTTEIAATCTGIDLSGQPDDAYALEARAVDAAGNTGPASTASYRLDRTPPAPPAFTAAPGASTRDATPEWRWSAVPGATSECRVRNGAAVLADWGACTSPAEVDLSTRPDGGYAFDVRALGENGLRSATATSDVRLDRVAPAAPVITEGPGAVSPDETPSWSFAAEAGATTHCRLERGGGVLADWGPCTSPTTHDLAAMADGTVTFRVRATDAAGNVGTSAASDFRLDRTLPGTPAIIGRPPSPGGDRTPTWTFTIDADRTGECRVTPPGGAPGGWAPCTSPYTAELGADGGWTFAVRQRTPAGVAGDPASHVFLLDTAAPGAPVITGGPGATGNRVEPAWSFDVAPDAAARCRLELDGMELRPWAACASPHTYGLAGAPDGVYRFAVQAVDAAGNASPAATSEHRLDRVPPPAPGFTGGPGPVGTARAISWTFAAGEPGAALECRLDPGESWAPCTSPRGVDLAGRSDGRYALAVRAVDAAGNRGPETVSTYELDTVGGAVQVLTGPGVLGRDRTVGWTFAGDAGGGYQCRLTSGALVVREWQPCGERFDGDLSGRPDGLFRLSVRTLDALGNIGPATTAEYALDTTAPDAPQIVEAPGERTTDRTPTWRFSAEPGTELSCRLEVVGDGREAAWEPCASPHAARLEAVEGTFRFAVRARDLARNTGAPATRSHVLERAAEPPSTEPARGAVATGSGTPAVAPSAPSLGAPADQAEVRSAAAVAEAARRRRAAAAARRRAARARVAERRVPPGAQRADTAPTRRRPAQRAPRPTPVPAREPRRRPAAAAREAIAAVVAPIGRAVATAAATVGERPDVAAFPLGLLALVGGFLGLQGRIDRSDPKLVLFGDRADEDLEFPDDAPVA